MADRFVTVQENDLGGGIDQQAAENRIGPGFAEDILNMDPLATGSIKTRPGYQGYLGNIPLRIKSIEYSDSLTDNLSIFMDGSVNLSSIDLSAVRSTPVIVFGRTSSANVNNAGDFPNDEDAAHYYTGFTVELKKIFETGTNTLFIPQAEHTFSDAFLFVGVVKSTSSLDNSNEIFFPDSVSIDKATYDISIDYTNGDAEFEGYSFVLDKKALAGSSYVSALESAPDSPTPSTFSYTAVTHGLSNFNIIVKAFEDTGTDLLEVIPEEVLVASDGEVSISILNTSGSSKSYYFVLAAAGALNSVDGSVSSESSIVVQIPELEKDFLFVATYLEDIMTGDLEQIYPDSITVDSTNKIASIGFTNSGPTSANFKVVYMYGNIATNKIRVDASVIGAMDAFTDSAPQLTLYGLPHTEVYGADLTQRQGVVNHIDSYRALSEDRLITGLGGNLFEARVAGDSLLETYNLAPTYYPTIRGRVASETTLGPCIYDTTDSPARSRGYLQSSAGASGFLEIDTATYQAGSGWTRYVLKAPGLVVTGTLSTIISSTAGLEDYIQIKGMGHSRLNGEFKIKAASVTADTVIIDVENPKITDGCFDEVDAGGLGGIFTERLTLLSTSQFLTGDIIESEIISDLEITTSFNSDICFKYISEEIVIPAGIRFVGSRNTNLLSLRELDGTLTNEMVVRGDMLELTGIPRQLRVLYVNSLADETVNIVGNDTTNTATVTVADSSRFAVGQTVLFINTVNYRGYKVITDILSPTEFTFSSTSDSTESALLIGNTVEIDETLNISDTLDSSVSLTVSGRFITIEAPSHSYDMPETTYTSHFNSFDYSNQPILRSVMVQDNMYFTNGSDEVMKYDGENIYRAGLFRWQPHLFSSVDTTAVGKIDTGNFTLSYSTVSDNRFTLTTAADSVKLNVGERLKDNRTSLLYTITKIDETAGTITVNRSILSSGAGALTVSTISQYSYYFRLNMVDRNNNIIGSAVVGSNDFVVTLGEDAAINLKLVGMPALSIYDYNRLEVQIYRSKANSFDNFFLLTTLPLSFNNGEGYIDYTDTDSDADLIKDDILSVSLAGAELATTLSEPLRAKYITSAGNRLVLGHVKDYPTIDLQIVQNQSGPIVLSNLLATGNTRYLLRKSNLDTGTVTNMNDRIAYEFTSNSTSITSIANNAGASFTVTATNTFTAGDWVYLFHSAVVYDLSLQYSGLFQVESATSSEFTILYSHSSTYSPGSSDVDKFSRATAAKDVPVFLGVDGNYNTFNGNKGTQESYEFIAVKRLANMINSSMRVYNSELFPDFKPFVVANAGGEFGFGQLILKQPLVSDTDIELVLPALNGDFDIFVNSVKRNASEQAGALTKEYPSRVLVSYTNYPEIFDNPTAIVDSRSESAIDINSADGQEITSVIPFFGDSAFGQASKSGIITVFKENSIYLTDLAAKDALSQNLVSNTPVIQKLETEGKGCTAPLSVAVTRQGIMFANFSGVYRLNRNLEIDYIGRKVQRIWRELVNKDNIQYITGHHYANGNQYKLSFNPISQLDGRNTEVLVYSHTREYEGGIGSWTVYDNHSVAGYANLLDDSYFATNKGQVFSIRRTGEDTDYRDDADPINSYFLARPLDFGDAGIRKNINAVITYYRTLADTDSVSLKSALDMESEFNDTDLFRINEPTDNTGLSDSNTRKVVTIRSSLQNSIGNYLQLLYSINQKDKPIEISGISVRVAGKDSKGMTEAISTRK